MKNDLDQIDLNILQVLQTDGAITNVKLAELVGLTASPCLQRVHRLEKAGYITGYTARINLAKIAEHVTLFVHIKLLENRPDAVFKFERALREMSGLVECHRAMGEYDYILRFLVQTVSRFQEDFDCLLGSDSGISKYTTHVVRRSAANLEALPIATLVGNAGRKKFSSGLGAEPSLDRA